MSCRGHRASYPISSKGLSLTSFWVLSNVHSWPLLLMPPLLCSPFLLVFLSLWAPPFCPPSYFWAFVSLIVWSWISETWMSKWIPFTSSPSHTQRTPSWPSQDCKFYQRKQKNKEGQGAEEATVSTGGSLTSVFWEEPGQATHTYLVDQLLQEDGTANAKALR
jgi:hypothetical protein